MSEVYIGRGCYAKIDGQLVFVRKQDGPTIVIDTGSVQILAGHIKAAREPKLEWHRWRVWYPKLMGTNAGGWKLIWPGSVVEYAKTPFVTYWRDLTSAAK